MRKKAGGLLLVGLLSVGILLSSALAAETCEQDIYGDGAPPPTSTSSAFDPNEGSGVEARFEATIAPRLISARVPCEVRFIMYANSEMELELGDGSTLTLTNIQNPETALVTNLSTIPINVKAAISDVSYFTENEIELVEHLDDVDAAGKAMLVLAEKSVVFQDQSEFEANALTGSGSTESPVVMSLDTDQSGNLWVYGKVHNDTTDRAVFSGTIALRIEPRNSAK